MMQDVPYAVHAVMRGMHKPCVQCSSGAHLVPGKDAQLPICALGGVFHTHTGMHPFGIL